nr:unnamed protein product [Digitaria exilis]
MKRQARKEAAAAAATRYLLKVDAARMRKAGAAQSRKNAAAPPMRKVPAPARAAPAPEATPPRSFSEGGGFFNGNNSDLFSSPG